MAEPTNSHNTAPMNPFWVKHILSACPLKIERVECNDPQLIIGGAIWHFNAIIPCRLLNSEQLLIGSSDNGFEAAIKKLVGVSIVSCLASGHGLHVDPCFILSNGQQLEFFSNCALEPWTMKLPKPPILVASPGDPKWAT